MVVILVSLAARAAANEKTLVFDDEWEVYTLTFDEARISGVALRNLSWFSPDMTDVSAPFRTFRGQDGKNIDKFFAPPHLTNCVPGDPAYKNCANNRPGSRTFFQNAAANIAKGKEQESRLARMQVPNQLRRVKQYLLTTLTLYESTEQAELAYLRTWDPGILISETDKLCGSDPNPALLRQLGGSGSHDEKFHLVDDDWQNLANQCILGKKGRYPIADWKKFLSDYGITEHYRVRRVD